MEHKAPKHNRTPVKSSAIVSVGYDEKTQLLQVEMQNGGVYDFPNFPPEENAKFMGAESMGKHFVAHIRPKFGVKKKQ